MAFFLNNAVAERRGRHGARCSVAKRQRFGSSPVAGNGGAAAFGFFGVACQ
jgi:hypothetical protein